MRNRFLMMTGTIALSVAAVFAQNSSQSFTGEISDSHVWRASHGEERDARSMRTRVRETRFGLRPGERNEGFHTEGRQNAILRQQPRRLVNASKCLN